MQVKAESLQNRQREVLAAKTTSSSSSSSSTSSSSSSSSRLLTVSRVVKVPVGAELVGKFVFLDASFAGIANSNVGTRPRGLAIIRSTSSASGCLNYQAEYIFSGLPTRDIASGQIHAVLVADADVLGAYRISFDQALQARNKLQSYKKLRAISLPNVPFSGILRR